MYRPRRGFRPVALYSTINGVVLKKAVFVTPEYTMKKKTTGAGSKASTFTHLAPVESELLGKLSQIIAHCAVVKYDDGDARKPGWITLKTMGSAWVLEAKDPDSCCRMTASADTLDNALTMLDLLLGSEEAPWEPDPWLRQQLNRKK